MFLTAAHCGEGGADRVRATFSTAYHDRDRTYTGTFHADSRFSQVQSDPHDIAVVVLDEPVAGITPTRLPAAGPLSALRHGQSITSVGYGASAVTQGHGGHQYLYDDVRKTATGSLNAVTPTWLRASMNPATGDAGTCYGLPRLQRRLPPRHRVRPGVPRPWQPCGETGGTGWRAGHQGVEGTPTSTRGSTVTLPSTAKL